MVEKLRGWEGELKKKDITLQKMLTFLSFINYISHYKKNVAANIITKISNNLLFNHTHVNSYSHLLHLMHLHIFTNQLHFYKNVAIEDTPNKVLLGVC